MLSCSLFIVPERLPETYSFLKYCPELEFVGQGKRRNQRPSSKWNENLPYIINATANRVWIYEIFNNCYLPGVIIAINYLITSPTQRFSSPSSALEVYGCSKALVHHSAQRVFLLHPWWLLSELKRCAHQTFTMMSRCSIHSLQLYWQNTDFHRNV